jgi:hypothetical protein
MKGESAGPMAGHCESRGMFSVGDESDSKRIPARRENMDGRYKDAEETNQALVDEINRLLDAIALHRREHTGGPYCARDRKLYAAIGFTPPAPNSRQSCEPAAKPRAK